MVDGGFEATTNAGTNVNWVSTSTTFGTSLCTIAGCGAGTLPRTGNAAIWFDDAASGAGVEIGTAQQSITIPAGTTATLTYYLRISRVAAPSNTVMTVTIDGTVVQTITEPAVAEAAYALRTVDLTPFANGSSRVLRFNNNRPAGGSGSDSFFVDDVIVSTSCAASVANISGRVTTPNGLNLRNAVVVLTNSQGVRTTATSSSFGLYSFSDVRTGETYTLGVVSKRYRFTARSMMVSGNATNVDFVGLE